MPEPRDTAMRRESLKVYVIARRPHRSDTPSPTIPGQSTTLGLGQYWGSRWKVNPNFLYSHQKFMRAGHHEGLSE
jgi:hypothetical protein